MDELISQTKQTPDHIKIIVNGFIREAQASFPKHIIYTIPALINLICLAYYHSTDYFIDCGDGITITDKGLKITKTADNISGSTTNTAYGTIRIPSNSGQCYEWKLDILSCGCAFGMSIGVEDASVDNTDKEFISRSSVHFAIMNDGDRYNFKGVSDTPRHRYDPGDVVTVYLNTKKAEITFTINNEKQNTQKMTVFPQIAIKTLLEYRLAVSLYKKGDSVKLHT